VNFFAGLSKIKFKMMADTTAGIQDGQIRIAKRRRPWVFIQTGPPVQRNVVNTLFPAQIVGREITGS
jgi:hypothetical protein